jgi:beta-lactamase regulating signal transducer with metallopeptidase domain
LTRQRIALSRALGDARTSDARLAHAAVEAASALGLPCAPAALVSSHDGSPFVCGIVRPRLVVPQSVLVSLSPQQLRHVLMHELAHIRRRDLLWGWVPEIVRTLWWFHPVVHWVVFRVRLERELACDQLAMALTGRDPAEYAATLVQVAGGSSFPFGAAALAAPAVGGATRGVNTAAKWGGD